MLENEYLTTPSLSLLSDNAAVHYASVADVDESFERIKEGEWRKREPHVHRKCNALVFNEYLISVTSENHTIKDRFKRGKHKRVAFDIDSKRTLIRPILERSANDVSEAHMLRKAPLFLSCETSSLFYSSTEH